MAAQQHEPAQPQRLPLYPNVPGLDEAACCECIPYFFRFKMDADRKRDWMLLSMFAFCILGLIFYAAVLYEGSSHKCRMCLNVYARPLVSYYNGFIPALIMSLPTTFISLVVSWWQYTRGGQLYIFRASFEPPWRRFMLALSLFTMNLLISPWAFRVSQVVSIDCDVLLDGKDSVSVGIKVLRHGLNCCIAN